MSNNIQASLSTVKFNPGTYLHSTSLRSLRDSIIALSTAVESLQSSITSLGSQVSGCVAKENDLNLKCNDMLLTLTSQASSLTSVSNSITSLADDVTNYVSDLQTRIAYTPQDFKTANNTWDNAFSELLSKKTDIYIPNDTYVLTQPLIISKERTNFIMGRNVMLKFTLPKSSKKNYSYAIKITGKYIKLQGGTISIQTSNQDITDIVLIDSEASNCIINEVAVRGGFDRGQKAATAKCEDGIRILGGETRIYGCKIRGCKKGILVQHQDLFIENTYIEQNAYSGFCTEGEGRAVDAYHIHSYANGGHGFYIKTGGHNFNNCYSDTNDSTGWEINNVSDSHRIVLNRCRSFKDKENGIIVRKGTVYRDGGFRVDGTR